MSDSNTLWKITENTVTLTVYFKDIFFYDIYYTLPIDYSIEWRCVLIDETLSKLTVTWFTNKLMRHFDRTQESFNDISNKLLFIVD